MGDQYTNFHMVRRGDTEEYDVYFTPIAPLKYIKVNVTVNYAPTEEVKLKTRFQLLKECS